MILEKIVQQKRQELDVLKRSIPLEEIKASIINVLPGRGFAQALRRPDRSTRIVAEIKKASPSAGTIRDDFSPGTLARTYEDNGAVALSVLTETAFFQGSPQHLLEAGGNSTLPVLRKDFVIDPYQIYESKILGADAVLLIVAILDPSLLKDLVSLALELKLDPLVEVHSREELAVALEVSGGIIGINNRNLKTLEVNIQNTVELVQDVPRDRTVISESGISKREQILQLQSKGVHGFLIGEAMMREQDVGKKLRELIGA